MNNEITCIACGKGDNEDRLLLCDAQVNGHTCNRGFHTYCVGLGGIPSGNWRCPGCVVAGNQFAAIAPPLVHVQGPESAFVYLRVSSKGQNNPQYGNHGLSTQNDSALEYARANGLVIKGTFTDIGSGYYEDQPQREKLVQELRKKTNKNSVVLVFSASRWSRYNNYDTIQILHSNNCHIYSISEKCDSYSQEFRNHLAMAKDQSEALSKAVQAAHKRIVTQGGTLATVAPFGSQIQRDNKGVRKMIVNQNEHIIKSNISRWAANYTSEQISDRLYQLGMTYRGKQWTSKYVSRITKCRKTPVNSMNSMKFINSGVDMESDDNDDIEATINSFSRMKMKSALKKK